MQKESVKNVAGIVKEMKRVVKSFKALKIKEPLNIIPCGVNQRGGMRLIVIFTAGEDYADSIGSDLIIKDQDELETLNSFLQTTMTKMLGESSANNQT